MEAAAVIADDSLDTAEMPEEIVLPARAAQLAVGREREPDLGLPGDDGCDLAVLDRAQLIGRDLAVCATLARLAQRRRSQQAADHVGTKWRDAPRHGGIVDRVSV